MTRTLLAAMPYCLMVPAAHAQNDPAVIFDMDTLRRKPAEITISPATAE